MKLLLRTVAGVCVVIAILLAVRWLMPAPPPQRDVIYGRKFGTAMTMDVYRPLFQNRAGIIWIISGAWYSDHNAIAEQLLKPFLKRGYTVFAITHSSTPKYNMADAAADVVRADRFIRANARSFGISKNRLGVIGCSSGGHLALYLSTHQLDGNPTAADPIERESCRIQAVAAFAPPSDFLNYGAEGLNAFSDGALKIAPQAEAFQEWDSTRNSYVPEVDRRKITDELKELSPIESVNAHTAPTLIFHGDHDGIVPLEQSVTYVRKLKENHVDAQLEVNKGSGHDFGHAIEGDISSACEWFDKYLRGVAKP